VHVADRRPAQLIISSESFRRRSPGAPDPHGGAIRGKEAKLAFMGHALMENRNSSLWLSTAAPAAQQGTRDYF
jgi:hypothetical protein